MIGRRYGGFIFDTNTIHKIELEGSGARHVVTLEWHPHGKILPLSTYDNPCPSRRRKVADMKDTWSKDAWLHGEARFTHYEPERAAAMSV